METASDSQDQLSVAPSARSGRLGPALASSIVPGLGQIFLGIRIGAVFLVFFVGLAISDAVFQLPRTYIGVALTLCCGIVLHLTSAIHALTTRPSRRDASNYWLFLLVPLALVGAVVCWQFSMRLMGFRAFTTSSSSMKPTLVLGDTFVCKMQPGGVAAHSTGKIILFQHNGLILIKRLIATEGDTVSIESGKTSVNGRQIEEPYALNDPDMPTDLANFGPIRVPQGEVFLLGDNRAESLDSRTAEFGSVKATDVVGTALYIVHSKLDRTGETLH